MVIVDAREIQSALLALRAPCLAENPVVLRCFTNCSRARRSSDRDAVFDSKQRAKLAGQTTFADHLLEQVAQ